ncbi:MAG: FAD-binding oxidoreductase [Rhodocyclaceae bacterium]|nr:FAD-binding oxidoreductase [Rhodocyclaceae bacterium]
MTDSADLLETLVGIVGADNVLTAPEDVSRFCADWRGRYQGRARAVVRPDSTDAVSAAVTACAVRRVPMVPQGGNTGLCGGATPSVGGDEIVISLERMNRVRHLDRDNQTLTVDAGCTLAAVQAVAAEAGCLFPLSLAAEGSCQIGGNLSTNAGGVHVLRYGNTRDLVLGVEAVLPDGRIWHGLRALRKNNTGYDLKHLFIGGEGTLGIVTAAVLKLFPAPSGRAVAWVAVAGPAQAVELLGRAKRRCHTQLNAFELIGRSALDLVLKHMPAARPPLAEVPEWSVLIELSGVDDADHLSGRLEEVLADAIEDCLVLDAAISRSEAQAEALWQLRENISEAQRIEGFSIKHDIALPVSRIVEFLQRAERALAARFEELRVVAFGHLGDGNLHYNLSAVAGDRNQAVIARTAEANRIVHDLVSELGGSISAEHGLGQLKREEILRYRDPVETELMRAVKAAIDPLDLMNPGKLLSLDKRA